MSIPYTLNENGVTFFFGGRQRAIASDHPQYTDIVAAISYGIPGALERLINVKQWIAVLTFGRVSICDDDQVRYDGKPVPEYLASRIIDHFNKGFPVEPLFKFAEKLMGNPTHDVREDLYKWLVVGNMPIFPDGDFAAYKLVQDDFSPIHDGPYGKDQSPGQIVTMPREKCNANRNDTCAEGLHFCSYDYLPIFQEWNNHLGKKIILLKINPADVVAIPTDYNLSKGRCCRFEVDCEIRFEDIKDDFGGRLVIHNFDDDYDSWEDEVEDDEWFDEADGYSDITLGDVTLVDEVSDEVFKSDTSKVSVNVGKKDEPTYQAVTAMIAALDGNKTKAALSLGISRSVLYRILRG